MSDKLIKETELIFENLGFLNDKEATQRMREELRKKLGLMALKNDDFLKYTLSCIEITTIQYRKLIEIQAYDLGELSDSAFNMNMIKMNFLLEWIKNYKYEFDIFFLSMANESFENVSYPVVWAKYYDFMNNVIIKVIHIDIEVSVMGKTYPLYNFDDSMSDLKNFITEDIDNETNLEILSNVDMHDKIVNHKYIRHEEK